MNATRLTATIGAAVLLAGASVAGAQPPRSTGAGAARTQMASARGMLERGEFRNAEVIYSAAIDVLTRDDRSLLAGAYFGRAFATHQRLVTGDTAAGRLSADAIVRDYAQAESLNTAALGAAAQNNIGLVLGAVGRHAEAAAAFRAAAQRDSSAKRATYYWHAGRELEAAGDHEAARAAYVAGFTADPKNDQICGALIDLLARHYPADSAIARAVRWSADTALARRASDGLIALLLRESPEVSDANAAKALATLASSWPTVRLGPAYFAAMVAEPLRRIASQRPSLADGVAALIDAYTPRDSTRAFVEPTTASWWRRETGQPDGRHAVWSRVLRSIGDAYNQQGSGAAVVARSYYEAALGWKRRNELVSPHVDRKAMLPLALIYLQSADAQSSTRLQDETRAFAEMLFDAKGAAYRAGDIAQIREFHTTLGAIYAAQGKWTGAGAQTAEFQLEGMRRATRELSRRTSVQLTDPPNLLEELAKHYGRTGKTREATEVTRDVRQVYTRIGRPDAADSAVRRIDSSRRPIRVDSTATPARRPTRRVDSAAVRSVRDPVTPAQAKPTTTAAPLTRTLPKAAAPASPYPAPASKPPVVRAGAAGQVVVPDSLKRDTTKKP